VGKVSLHTPAAAGDTVTPGWVVRGSQGNLKVMILGVGIHAAGGFLGVENVQQDCRRNVLWVGCFWRVDAGRVGKEAEPKAFKFEAFTGDGTEYDRTFSKSDVTSCSHAQPCCCGDVV
jgi:hypothetical protein